MSNEVWEATDDNLSYDLQRRTLTKVNFETEMILIRHMSRLIREQLSAVYNIDVGQGPELNITANLGSQTEEASVACELVEIADHRELESENRTTLVVFTPPC